jgi:hypothetical protein
MKARHRSPYKRGRGGDASERIYFAKRLEAVFEV